MNFFSFFNTLVRSLLILAGIGLLSGNSWAKSAPTSKKGASKMVVVVMEVEIGKTQKGTIEIELNSEKAPLSVANFLGYVDSNFYDGVVFHRVIPQFMIQGGGFTPNLKQKPTKAEIKNESTNGLKNDRGTIAMARTSAPHSATSQFYINHADNDSLNFRPPNSWGYAVFGKVISGMEWVDKIAIVKRGASKQFQQDVPQETVLIKSIRRKTGAKATPPPA